MKPVLSILCLALLLGVFWITASIGSDGAAAALNSDASSALNQVHAVAPPADGWIGRHERVIEIVVMLVLGAYFIIRAVMGLY